MAVDAGSIIDATAVDAAALRFAAQPIDRGTPPPAGAKRGAQVVGGVRFTDADGPAEVWLLETASRDRRSIALAVRYLAGADLRLVREVNDRADACADVNLTGYAPAAVTLSDLDGDGRAEVGFGYYVGCAGGDTLVKQLWLRGADKFIVRGVTAGAGEPEPGAARWPTGALAATVAAFDANAGALDVADVAPTSDDRVYDSDDAGTAVVRDERRGKIDYRLSYPTLPMLGRGDAAMVTKAMRETLGFTDRYPADQIGIVAGNCTLGLITRAVISVRCEVLVDLTTQQDLDDQTGGAASGPAMVGLSWWRGPGRPRVRADELLAGVSERCPWALTPDGVEWLPDPYVDATCPDDTTAWDALKPTTAAGRALIAAMTPPDAADDDPP